MGTVHAKVNSIAGWQPAFLCLFDHDLPVQSVLKALQHLYSMYCYTRLEKCEHERELTGEFEGILANCGWWKDVRLASANLNARNAASIDWAAFLKCLNFFPSFFLTKYLVIVIVVIFEWTFGCFQTAFTEKNVTRCHFVKAKTIFNFRKWCHSSAAVSVLRYLPVSFPWDHKSQKIWFPFPI